MALRLTLAISPYDHVADLVSGAVRPNGIDLACLILTVEDLFQLDSIDWYQGGVNEAGRREHVQLQLPQGVRCTVVADRSLNEMLLAGDLDAVISARPPRGFDNGQLVRLLEDPHTAEERYWRDTGIFPIMHVISIRGDVYERQPWVAIELFRAFDEARRRSVERLFDLTASRVPLAWPAHQAQESAALFGEEYWPYGIQRNSTTLDAFLRLAYEHGVCARRLTPAELFPPEFSAEFRV